METFIITSKPKEQFDNEGNSLGLSVTRILCYLPSTGRRRIYRSNLSETLTLGLKALKFKRKCIAEKRCLEINEQYNDDFIVEVRNS